MTFETGFYLPALLIADFTPCTEFSAKRQEGAARFLRECEGCLGPGVAALREALRADLEQCAATGTMSEEVMAFLEAVFEEAVLDAQDIEGDNSRIRRFQNLCRAMKMYRTSLRLHIAKGVPLPYDHFLLWETGRNERYP